MIYWAKYFQVFVSGNSNLSDMYLCSPYLLNKIYNLDYFYSSTGFRVPAKSNFNCAQICAHKRRCLSSWAQISYPWVNKAYQDYQHSFTPMWLFVLKYIRAYA